MKQRAGNETDAHRGRRSIRLPAFDYAQEGVYFITVCTNGRECTLGKIQDGELRLSDVGKIVQQCWSKIPGHFERVSLDEFVVMPNHVHGILMFGDLAALGWERSSVSVFRTGLINQPVGVRNSEPLQNKFQHIIPKSVGVVINSFKGAVTRICNKRGFTFRWQRSYYDRIVRDEDELDRIREYIISNPRQWSDDKENPAFAGSWKDRGN